MPTIEQVIGDPSTWTWMRQALVSALGRDPMDAANDAHVLKKLLENRVDMVFEAAVASGRITT